MTAIEKEDHGLVNALAWYDTIVTAMAKLHSLDCIDHDAEKARSVIEEMPLSVLVRDGWRSPGSQPDDGAEEYEILLTTGGPACRVYGRLGSHDEPERAHLQYQDWYQPWLDAKSDDIILDFAQQFYFG